MVTWLIGYIHFSLALLAICSPQAVIPLFINLTDGMGTREKARVARTAMITVASVLTVSAFFGKEILTVLGATLDSFRVAGGILLMTIAFGMIKAMEKRHTKEEQAEAENKDTIGTVPLGMPLLAGPGTISVVVIEAQTNPSIAHFSMVVCSIVTLAVVCWIVLLTADRIGRFLGQTGINIISRIFGLLLASVAVQLIYSSLRNMFPAWVAG